MGWIWLDAPRLDFGRPDAEEWEGERTVWIYADPHTVLGVPASADEGELQRAYRRLARVHHPDLNPDDDDALERFHELQRAYAVATGKGEVAVEPTSGAWWRLTGISGSPSRGSLAVAGLSFELRDAHRVPFRDAEDTVRVTYAGRSFPLTVAHSRGATAAALWQARAAGAAEWSLLVLTCLVLV